MLVPRLVCDGFLRAALLALDDAVGCERDDGDDETAEHTACDADLGAGAETVPFLLGGLDGGDFVEEFVGFALAAGNDQYFVDEASIWYYGTYFATLMLLYEPL